jgi:SAM-dependent methyltransferase
MESEERGDLACRVCGGQTKESYEAREMMYGLRTRFLYAQCAGCGSLSLTDPPADFAPYYSDKYYSFEDTEGGAKGRIKRAMRARRDAVYFGSGGPLGRLLARRFEDGALLSVSKLNVSLAARILDVGCGCGKLLHQMAALGFTNLSGVDPFLPIETSNTNGVTIMRAHLENVTGEKYDLVMFHHSLEHVADPKATLRAAARVLARDGRCLVRLPMLGAAWEEYGTNWVQLSPPRHMWIPTEKAMSLLAGYTGWKVEKVEYDSTELQFWASELYRRDIPFRDVDARRLKRHFRPAEIAQFRSKALDLNRSHRGDQAAFILRRDM